MPHVRCETALPISPLHHESYLTRSGRWGRLSVEMLNPAHLGPLPAKQVHDTMDRDGGDSSWVWDAGILDDMCHDIGMLMLAP
jgi:hypothetical protein